jgi:uncharacterized membrane protein
MSWNDKRIENWVGYMLRTGVMLAAAIVLIGGMIYLAHNHGARPDYSHFHGETVQLMTVSGILHGVASFDARSIIMLGLLILIATPIARVGMCIVGFLLEGDRLYVAVSSVVLLILLYGLFFHK